MILSAEELPWLPRLPNKFIDQLGAANSVRDFINISKHYLDDSELSLLYKRFNSICSRIIDPDNPLVEVSIGLVSNSNTNLHSQSISGTALRFGISLKVIETEFNQVNKEASSAQSIFYDSKLTAILIAIDSKGLPIQSTPGDLDKGNSCVNYCFDYLMSICEALHKKHNVKVILQNIVPPPIGLQGSLDRTLPGTEIWIINQLNSKLDGVCSPYIHLLDVVGLASYVGMQKWYDPILWNIAKVPFSTRCTPIYSEFICRILGGILGKNKRCLVLDLDNTLWGGVIGDDGINGIQIGNGSPSGESFLSLQFLALELRKRGIILAVSSKNEYQTAADVFINHPEMALKLNHFAAFQANWSDKASNLKEIANMLSLGLDSFVFLDDNPAERHQVRQSLPEVAVPELPNDPAFYASILNLAGYFDVTRFSSEDSQRAEFYNSNLLRKEIFKISENFESYLNSLMMEIFFSPFADIGLARVEQLVNKSNQFNLTTKRYSSQELSEIQENHKFFTAQIRLTDIFGDNGMISVLICEKDVNSWRIDTWLMSCRVLERGVENAVLSFLISAAQRRGINKIIGTYVPTARNSIVKDHYKKLGFRLIKNNGNEQTWGLDIAEYKFPKLHMKISINGYED